MVERVEDGESEMNSQFTRFQINAAVWAAEQYAKACLSIFAVSYSTYLRRSSISSDDIQQMVANWLFFQAELGIIGLNFQEVDEANKVLETIELMEKLILIIIQTYNAYKNLYSIISFVAGMTIGNGIKNRTAKDFDFSP